MSILKTIYLQHLNGANPNATLDPNGNVGIGTTNTVTKLVVQGDNVPSTGQVSIRTTSANNYAQLTFWDRNTSGLRIFQDYTSGSNLGVITNDSGNTLQLSNYVTIPNQPRFHAKGLNTVTNNSNIVFPTAVFNVGNHYNTSNGRFTAPIAGYYMFGWTNIGSDANDVFRWRFYVNGSTVGDIHLRQDTKATGSEYATNGMYVIPWLLSAGDYVNIYYAADGGTIPYGSGQTTDDYPRFWGYLLG